MTLRLQREDPLLVSDVPAHAAAYPVEMSAAIRALAAEVDARA